MKLVIETRNVIETIEEMKLVVFDHRKDVSTVRSDGRRLMTLSSTTVSCLKSKRTRCMRTT